MNQKKVVLFEDSEGDIELFKDAAQEKGIKVLAIRTPGRGEELRKHIEKIKKIELGLIVVDIGFYGSNIRGYTILKEIAATPTLRDVPVVVWSLYLNDTPQGKAMKKKLEREIGPKFKKIDFISKHQEITEILRFAGWTETKKTVLFVTHYIEEAVFLADRIIIISDKKFIADISVPFSRPRSNQMRFSHDFLKMKHDVLEYMQEI